MTLWLNLALGVVLIVWTVASVALLLTGFGLPFSGSEYSLAALLAWAIWNYKPSARASTDSNTTGEDG